MPADLNKMFARELAAKPDDDHSKFILLMDEIQERMHEGMIEFYRAQGKSEKDYLRDKGAGLPKWLPESARRWIDGR